MHGDQINHNPSEYGITNIFYIVSQKDVTSYSMTDNSNKNSLIRITFGTLIAQTTVYNTLTYRKAFLFPVWILL